MRLLHVAVGVSSSTRAQAFYGELLGLAPAAGPVTLPVALCRDLFGLAAELQKLDFEAEGVHLEAFVLPETERVTPSVVAHACLEVTGCADLVQRCERLGYPVRQAAKGDSVVVFIADLDGNWFELKERAGCRTISAAPR
jgi:catechol 2,3-dioxygenase-like lactoylglutathione lyase family enzyme